jgi:hypothetical protein
MQDSGLKLSKTGVCILNNVNLPTSHSYALETTGRHTGILCGLHHFFQQVVKGRRIVHPGAISGQPGVDPADEFINIPNVKG